MKADNTKIDDAFLEQFGTKGMRWGVRKERTDYGHGKKGEGDKKGDKKGGDKPKTVVGKTKTTGKSGPEMSDVQLKRVLARIQMEQQYAKMTDPGPKGLTNRILKSTVKFASQAARQVAMTQVTALGNDKASQKIGSLLSKKAAAETAKNLAKLGSKNLSFT